MQHYNFMSDFKEIELSEDTSIGLRIPISTPQHIQIDIILNGKTYCSLPIPIGVTGEFYLGQIGSSKKNKKNKLLWKFPLKLTSMNVKTGIVDLHFERKEK